MAPETSGLPPSVRLIRGARFGLERHWRWLLLLVPVALLIALAALVPYTIDADQSGALLTLGRLHETAIEPGLHLRIPWVQDVRKVSTGKVARLEIFGELVPTLSFLSADTNLIDTSVVLQYRIGSLGDYLYGTENPEQLLRLLVRAALVEEMAAVPVDDVLTSAKIAIQGRVRQSVQERLDRHRCGLLLLAVNLQSVAPPQEAAGAFRDVSDARAEAAQAVDKAEGQRGRRLRLTRGEAEQILAAARTQADGRRQQARGAADRYLALLESYRVMPEQTRNSLYHETLREVLPRTRIIVLAPGETPRLDIELIDVDPRAVMGFPSPTGGGRR